MEETKNINSTLSTFYNLDNMYYFIKGYSIANNFKYTIIALSLAFKYYESRFQPGSCRFIVVIMEVYNLILSGNGNDYTCAYGLIEDIIMEYSSSKDKEAFSTRYSFTKENIEAIRILSSIKNYNFALTHNPLQSVTRKKKMPKFHPYQEPTEISKFIAEHARLNNYENTKKALELATKFHNGQFRKSGEPYIIHPLRITLRIIYSGIDDDVTCAASLLHDLIEDAYEIEECNGEILTTKYGISSEVLRIVRLLTKPKNYKITDPDEVKYYEGIKSDIRAATIKLYDRCDNISTIDVFTFKKMLSYVDETKKLVYPLFLLKYHHPEYSQAFTNLKYVLRSNCEIIESILKREIAPTDIDFTRYQKTLFFIQGYATGKNMVNTLRALEIITKLHDGQFRSIGDPFIIHPLRVALYLINLKINDDVTCAAALLHEVFKKCGVTDEGKALTEVYNLSPEVFELVKLVSKPNDMSKEEYYDKLQKNPKALLIKLSNRANTCTILNTYDSNDISEYISECNNFIYPMCDRGTEDYSQYSQQIIMMRAHIHQITHIVGFLKQCE